MRLSSNEKQALRAALANNNDPLVKSALSKITEISTRPTYVRGKKQIAKVLYDGFKRKQDVKIQYYSLSSDETRYRVVSIRQYNPDWIIAYCHLREEERTFVTERIRSAALLNEKYTIPKGWKPHSRVWSGP